MGVGRSMTLKQLSTSLGFTKQSGQHLGYGGDTNLNKTSPKSPKLVPNAESPESG